MHRKEFLIAASCLTVLGLLLASCGPAAAPAPTAAAKPPALAAQPTAQAVQPTATMAAQKPSPPTPSPKPAAGAPRYGGILAISAVEDPLSMDLHQESVISIAQVLQVSYSGVVQPNPDKPEELIGDLAKSWEMSKDGLTYTFRLHDNIKFHDGTALTAEDIKYSYDRQLNPPAGIRSIRRADIVAIDKVEALDKSTVRFALKYPSPPTLQAIGVGWMVIYSKDFVEKKGHMKNDVMGSGPFKLKRYSQGVSLEHVKHSEYFVPGRPYLDGITFYIIKDAAARLAALRTGQIKLTGVQAAGLTSTDAETLAKSGSTVQVVPYNSLAFSNLVFNTEQKPWSDIRVRKAAHLAIDRQKAIDVVAQGYGEQGSHMPGEWGIARDELLTMPGWRQPKDADLAEAKKLLADAGYPQGFKTKAMTMTNRNYVNLSVFLADQLAKIGIEMEVETKEVAVRTSLLNQGNFLAHPLATSSLGYFDPLNIARYWAPPQAGVFGLNFQRYVDDKIVDLFDKQARTIDPAERKKLVRDLDLRMIDSATRPMVFWWKDLLGMWPEVKDRKPPLGFHSGLKYQDVWLAK
ncbi:MAG: ABC transporter substrate-binding protein [Chloroflexi bacterium]|nr:ABC transporter substrate-binding protein [Chloroflexota bacterium]